MARTVARIEKLWLLLVAFAVLVTSHRSVAAQQPSPAKPLRVATKVSPPFSMKDAEGHWTGLSIDLWRKIASELKLEYELVETDLASMVDGLRAKQFDAAVAALTATFDREQDFDFTHAFFSSGLGIAVAPTGESTATEILRVLLDGRILKILGTVGLVLGICGLLVWLVERRRNPEQFGGGVLRGIGAGLWWSIVTGSTVGYGDKAPVTLLGRLLAVAWIFASILLISVFTGALASAFTISELRSDISGPEDLPRVIVGTVDSSTAMRYLEDNGVASLSYPTAQESLDALRHGLVDAVVYDSPILRYLISSKHLAGLRVLPVVIELQNYAIGLAADSPHRENINRVLLKLTQGREWREALVRYLGSDS